LRFLITYEFIFTLKLEYNLRLTKLIFTKVLLLKAEHPFLFKLLGKLISLCNECSLIYNKYAESKKIVRGLVFIVYLYNFNLGDLDLNTCVYILNGIFLLVTLFTEYINPNFAYDYPLAYKLYNYISTLLCFYDLFSLFHRLFMMPYSRSGDGSASGSGNNTGGNGGGKKQRKKKR
jgi:hypothetical protein